MPPKQVSGLNYEGAQNLMDEPPKQDPTSTPPLMYSEKATSTTGGFGPLAPGLSVADRMKRVPSYQKQYKSSQLSQAIARSKRAKPSSRKYG